MAVKSFVICVVQLCTFCLSTLSAENTDATLDEIASQYSTVRDLTLDPNKVLEVDSFSISRDVGEFDFRHGRIYFFRPVSGRVIAAYFEGAGTFRLSTDNEIEKQQLVRLAGKEIVDLGFEQAMFLFSDSTYEQISSIHDVAGVSIPDTVDDVARIFRRKIRERFVWNMDARILADLIGDGHGDFFSAFLECSDDKELLYVIDPLDEEEVSLFRYEQIEFSKRADFETWYSSAPKQSFSKVKPKFDISRLRMKVEIGTDQKLEVNADMHFVCLFDKARIVPIHLEHVLRVETAILNDTDTCRIIQEDKDTDAQLWIVFPYVLQKGKEYDLALSYSGEGLIEDIGGDNFSIVGRAAWFPSFYANIVDPRHFNIIFAVPKNMTLLATGELVRTWTEENKVYSEWDSGIEHLVAGFNYGKFSAVTQQSPLAEITCYTNEKLSDALLTVRRILEEDLHLQAELMLMPQELTTDGIGKNAAIECRNAYEVYNHFFGGIPIHRINISQQPQVSFAMSLPTLIFLPFTAFYDESVRQRLFEPVIGLRKYGEWEFYHEGVAAHEIAHQWWGHSVMISSYHDEWLDEGFATYSEALHLQVTKGIDDFKKYMNTLRRQIFSDAGNGMSLAELGPIWLGSRLSSLEAPHGKHLIYVKGAYVLHMLRMMLFDYDKKSDERFIKMMQDYVRTYTGKVVTTEDFKRIVEKHFGKKMDWFFDQWVYDTEIPVYQFNYDIENAGDDYFLTIIGQQRNVSSDFEMPVPFVVNFKKGHAVVRLTIKGNEMIARKFHLPQEPLSIEANPWSAVLCTIVE
jgi:hypothetical protein